VRFSII